MVYLANSQLPYYTILVPLFKEAEVISSLVKALNKLDYPKDKLQILLIIEAEDRKTQDAITKINAPDHFKVVVVPYSYPQTKAKACNYAMSFATGEYICIYDAEDRPDANQLKMVVSKFAESDSNIICVQCRLCFYNGHENLLTSFFEMEYQILFTFILPVAAHYNLPIPLGGTSNHFKTSVLREVGCWDSYNVTEDADLGLRIALAGYQTKMVLSYTHEEAPIGIKAWIKQRNRWLKGYFHTCLIYLRYPGKVIKQFKPLGMLFFTYMMLLSPLLTLLAPLLIILTLAILLNICQLSYYQNITFTLLSWINFTTSSLYLLFTSYIMIKVTNKKYLDYKWLILKFYYVLHVFSSIMAIYKLFKEPHKWDKTTHGITKVKN